MNRTAIFGASTLSRCSFVLCCALTIPTFGCVGSVGKDGAPTAEIATGTDDSNSGEKEIDWDAEAPQRRVELPNTGGAPPPVDEPNPPAVICDYPEGDGDWAVEAGSTLPQSLQWQGFAENSSETSTVKIEDYLDCDGSRGINALLLDISALWCGSCAYEASKLPEKMASGWKAKGIRVLTLIVQDSQGNPGTVENAKNWKNAFSLESTAVVADPDFTFLPPSGTVALPEMVVVNPRNMQIASTADHPGQADPLVEALAAQNQLP